MLNNVASYTVGDNYVSYLILLCAHSKVQSVPYMIWSSIEFSTK